VLEEFRNEPAEAEFFFLGGKAGDFFFLAGRRASLAGNEDQLGFKPARGFFDSDGFRGLRAGTKIQELMSICFKDEN
jgi:hypothetical protein